MFLFNGTEYKSKSVVALNMLKEDKDRTEISKALGITYQTVHAIMKKAGLKAMPRKKAEAKVVIATGAVVAEPKAKKAKKSKPVTQAVENTESSVAQ
jgi:hypothetical protein